jgi:hypothetical protein
VTKLHDVELVLTVNTDSHYLHGRERNLLCGVYITWTERNERTTKDVVKGKGTVE